MWQQPLTPDPGLKGSKGENPGQPSHHPPHPLLAIAGRQSIAGDRLHQSMYLQRPGLPIVRHQRISSQRFDGLIQQVPIRSHWRNDRPPFLRSFRQDLLPDRIRGQKRTQPQQLRCRRTLLLHSLQGPPASDDPVLPPAAPSAVPPDAAGSVADTQPDSPRWLPDTPRLDRGPGAIHRVPD
jgi:hypothetical protein